MKHVKRKRRIGKKPGLTCVCVFTDLHRIISEYSCLTSHRFKRSKKQAAGGDRRRQEEQRRLLRVDVGVEPHMDS